jgi:hypothetical protein
MREKVMINLMAYLTNERTNMSLLRKYLIAQAENSMHFGWLPVFYCNENVNVEGIETRSMPEVPPGANKAPAACKLIALKAAMSSREVIWIHDLDAWQDDCFDGGPLFSDIGGCWYKTRINGGSLFFRHGAIDLVDEMIKAIPQKPKRTIEERLLGKLSRRLPSRVTLLNSTWNVGATQFKRRRTEAETPIKVFHFHPERKKRTKQFKPFISDRLASVLGRHFGELP